MLAVLLIACMKPAPLPPSPRLSEEEGLTAELVSQGGLVDRLAAPDDANVVILYSGEQRGDVAPCGCADSPRGGLPRTGAYMDALDDSVRIFGASWLDDGTTLDGQPMADAAVKNTHMIASLRALETDVAHVGLTDAIALSRMSDPPDLPMVSANIQGPGISPYVIVEHGGLRVGFTGVAAPGHIAISTPGYVREQPATAGHVVTELAAITDLIVLMNDGATDASKKLIRSGHIDVVIETAKYRAFETPFRQGRAVWVRSHDQGQRLGELRLRATEDGVVSVTDRKIDLDMGMPDSPELKRIAEQAEAELKALDRALFRP